MNKKTLVNEMLHMIPELKSLYDEEMAWWGDEEPGLHNIVGDVLTHYLVDLLDRNENQELLVRVFKFLEMMATSEDDYVVNVLQVTVLEVVGDSKKVLRTAYWYMGDETRRLSDEIERFLGRL